jgi:glycosyltransferase involved in cell wall biosynthesis
MQHFLDNFEEFIQPNTVTAIIHNGVDAHRFRPRYEDRAALRQSLGLPQDALVMGTVAGLAIDERPKAVLSVFAKLKEKTRLCILSGWVQGQWPKRWPVACR